MLKHKWHNDECVKCNILREIDTVVTKMAMVGNKDIYKYERKYKYITDGIETFERPNCYRTTYDN